MALTGSLNSEARSPGPIRSSLRPQLLRSSLTKSLLPSPYFRVHSLPYIQSSTLYLDDFLIVSCCAVETLRRVFISLLDGLRQSTSRTFGLRKNSFTGRRSVKRSLVTSISLQGPSALPYFAHIVDIKISFKASILKQSSVNWHRIIGYSYTQ